MLQHDHSLSISPQDYLPTGFQRTLNFLKSCSDITIYSTSAKISKSYHFHLTARSPLLTEYTEPTDVSPLKWYCSTGTCAFFLSSLFLMFPLHYSVALIKHFRGNTDREVIINSASDLPNLVLWLGYLPPILPHECSGYCPSLPVTAKPVTTKQLDGKFTCTWISWTASLTAWIFLKPDWGFCSA